MEYYDIHWLERTKLMSRTECCVRARRNIGRRGTRDAPCGGKWTVRWCFVIIPCRELRPRCNHSSSFHCHYYDHSTRRPWPSRSWCWSGRRLRPKIVRSARLRSRIFVRNLKILEVNKCWNVWDSFDSTYRILSFCIRQVCEGTWLRRHRLMDLLGLDKSATEAGTTRIYSIDLMWIKLFVNDCTMIKCEIYTNVP